MKSTVDTKMIGDFTTYNVVSKIMTFKETAIYFCEIWN